MQSVFFLSLFSLVFLMFSSMTTGLSKNLMQANLERIETTEKMFEDIKQALTVIAFKQKNSGIPIVDLSDSDLTDLSGDFLSQHLGYSTDELETDPWGSRIYLFRADEQETIWGASGGQVAKAPVTTLMLVSAGPNKVYDSLVSMGVSTSIPNPSLSQLKNLDTTDPDKVVDDVVVRFDTYEAMLDIWEKSQALDRTIQNISLDYFKNKLDAFSPIIQIAQRDTEDGELKVSIFDNLDKNTLYDPFDRLRTDSTTLTNEWYDPSGNIRAKLWTQFENPTDLTASYTGGLKLEPEIVSEFNDKYDDAEFQFPTFQVIEDEGGFEHIGVTNISTMDPFVNTSAEVDHEYDVNDPAKVELIRKTTSADAKKWEINKKLVIDGLGEL